MFMFGIIKGVEASYFSQVGISTLSFNNPSLIGDDL